MVGWVDHFATWLSGLQKKVAAEQDVAVELQEGALMITAAAERAAAVDRARLEVAAAELGSTELSQEERTVRAAALDLAALMRRYADRDRQSEYPLVLGVDVARERARTGAWYELFPRSAAAETRRDGPGLRLAAARLPAVAAMGFDVVYLPPIHPIGRVNRKGPDNTLEAGPGDPGSPWAIGAAEGGHTAIHPDLGDLDDFAFFYAEAERHGLEVALDLAFQCAPDHPWVAAHPTFFKQRPDGSVQYAENPPKKYQDIYPLHFDTPDWRELWQALEWSRGSGANRACASSASTTPTPSLSASGNG